MNPIKHILPVLSRPHFLVNHKYRTYYQSMNTNQQRFVRQNLKDAEFLNQSHDQMCLIEVLAATALERSQIRNTYFKAKQTCKIAEHLSQKYKSEALKLDIKLANTLSTSSDICLQKLYKVSDDHFNALYSRYMKKNLSGLMQQLHKYVEKGKNVELVDFSSKTLMQLRKVDMELNAYNLQLHETN